MTDREQKLQRALEWLIDLHEDAINRDGNYCQEFCPVRGETTGCPAEHRTDIKNFYERNYQQCIELQVKYYVEKANE